MSLRTGRPKSENIKGTMLSRIEDLILNKTSLLDFLQNKH